MRCNAAVCSPSYEDDTRHPAPRRGVLYSQAQMEPLLGKNTAELTRLSEELGQPAYRGAQLARWIYRRGAAAFGEMTDLPERFRSGLADGYTVGLPQIAHRSAAPDSTIKYLLRLADGQEVESVYLPYPDRVSVCLSSQVGCPAGCSFCATAIGGLARNLTAGEIAGQVLVLQADNPDRRISHCVYMGMGEPLLNYQPVVDSVRLLTGEMGLSARHVT